MEWLADAPGRYRADGIALVHGATRWTWADLDHHSRLWSATLAARGVVTGDLVAFTRENGPDFFALTFGIYRAGATPAPLSPKLPAAEHEAVLRVMRPRLHVDRNDEPDSNAPACEARLPAPSWKACTSGGSTGLPKVIVDGRLAGFAPGTDFIGIPADDSILVPGPLYHNAPFSAGVFALSKGSSVVTMERFDAEQALALIERERVAWSIMVPTMLNRIMMLPEDVRSRFDLSSWKMVVHTAAPMPAWLKRAWIEWQGADHIWEVYGATEGLVRCWIGGAEWIDHPGSVGRPIGGARLKILDEHGAEVATGDVGEIFAMPPGGPRSSYRYIGADRRVAADGWESVGDCGWIDTQGYLYLADRKSDMIISGGINIWPAEVEAAILRHPAVASCAVYGEPDDDLGQRVHAVVETAAPLSMASLQALLADQLARDKWPRALTCRSEPVRDDAGKFRKPQGL